jgi:hypothetical protein
MSATHPFWTSVFVDLAREAPESTVAFWSGVTGYRPSPWRGEDGELATLLPPSGDDHLRVQRLRAGPSRLHLDLHVGDPAAAAEEAVRLGARVVAERGYVVMDSPGGFAFCFVTHPASTPAPAATWPGGHESVVDQVCLDIPSSSYDAECDFWRRLTGWEPRVSADRAEFRRLVRPPGQPLQLLLQRLGEVDGPVRAHLDLATTDRAAETERHVALGAGVREVTGGWTVLADPAGSAYCITDRTPGTRVLDEVPAD